MNCTLVFLFSYIKVKYLKYNKFDSNCVIIQTLINQLFREHFHYIYVGLLIYKQYYLEFNIWRVKLNTTHRLLTHVHRLYRKKETLTMEAAAGLLVEK